MYFEVHVHWYWLIPLLVIIFFSCVCIICLLSAQNLGAGVAAISIGSSGVKGLLRFVQVDPGTCFVEGAIDKLPTSQPVFLTVHETGDVSDGCNSCGSFFRPADSSNNVGNLSLVLIIIHHHHVAGYFVGNHKPSERFSVLSSLLHVEAQAVFDVLFKWIILAFAVTVKK